MTLKEHTAPFCISLKILFAQVVILSKLNHLRVI